MPSSTGKASPESTVVGIPKSNSVDCGTAALDAADCGLSPIALVAFTRNVYDVPFVRPVIVALTLFLLPRCKGVMAAVLWAMKAEGSEKI